MPKNLLPPLNALRAFEATARNLSFAKAAEELNLTPSAVSHQVRTLEDFVGQRLFERMSRSIRLTSAGARALPFISDGFDKLRIGAAEWHAGSDDGVLVVGTGPAFAAKWLAPQIYRFVDRHPGIELRLAASLKQTDFRAEQIDAVIRFGPGPYPGLHTERLVSDAVLPLASPALVDGPHPIRQPADLRHHTLLHDDSMAFMARPLTWADWLRDAGVADVSAERGPRFSHADHGIDAAIDGAGVVLGRDVLAARDLRRGTLLAPFDLKLPTGASFWFVCPPDRLETEKVRVFRDWVFEEMQDM